MAAAKTGKAASIRRGAGVVNSRAELASGRVRPLEQPLELLLEQQIGQRDLVFDGFARNRGVTRRFEFQVRVDFTLLGHELQTGFSGEMNHDFIFRQTVHE